MYYNTLRHTVANNWVLRYNKSYRKIAYDWINNSQL